MKAHLLLFCLLANLAISAQSSCTINLLSKDIGSSTLINVFLNDELAGTVGDMENLQCKVFSQGRITVTVTYPEAYIRRTSAIDVERGKTYYMIMKNNYTFSVVKEEDWKDLSTAISKTIKFEESHRSPIIKGQGDDDSGPKQGTCFLVSKKGYVVTNYHVISNSKTIQIKGVGGDFSTIYGADVVAVDVDNDLALLKFKNQNIAFEEPPYCVAKTGGTQGAKAFVLGYPLAKSMGEEIKLTDGLISAKSGYKGSLSQYQFSAPIQPGNSGSPLFNESGEVIGVANAKLEGAEGAGYAIKSQYLLTFFSMIDNYSYAPVPNPQIKPLALNEKVDKLKNFIYIVKTESE